MLISYLDNFRYLCPHAEGDPTVAIATDDDGLYWVIVIAKNVKKNHALYHRLGDRGSCSAVSRSYHGRRGLEEGSRKGRSLLL
jgi:phage head maturation protease